MSETLWQSRFQLLRQVGIAATQRAATLVVLVFSATVTLSAQSLTTIHTFDEADGFGTTYGMVQDIDGNFYGTTLDGGTNVTGGTVFKITPKGGLTTLHVTDEHGRGEYDSRQVYEFQFSDKTTREFLVVGQLE